ncbi:MAG: TRAP transporter large permease [Syntrophomonadaceae bacterium]|nr:TRAP transporter large permease [Syntrophomonadaceae bacterium]
MAGLLFGTLIILFMLGLPIALAIGLTSITVLMTAGVNLIVLPQRMFAGTDSFPLVAVPFFILAGDLLAKGRVSEKLVEFAESIFGFLRGGLWVVSVLASMFFAAISGSGAATTAAVGTPLVPELKKKNYQPEFSAALIAAGGCTGVVIPPSVPMVLYAVIANESVSRLFLNGFIPGILMGGVLIAIALREAARNNYPRGAAFSFANVWQTLKGAFWGLMTPVIILGGIFSGFFTPTEAAVIAVNWALFVAVFIYKDLGWRDVFNIITRSAVTMSVVMFIIATSSVLSWVLANWQIPSIIANAVLSLSENKYVILLLINVIILVAGVFMETASALIILTPVFLPLIIHLEVSLIHFGIIMVLGLAIGMITPPVAINLYVASTITQLPIERISRAVIPMVLSLISVLLLITYLPLFVDVIF